METLAQLANGFVLASTPSMLIYCLVGVSVGMFIGVLPGIGALSGVAIVLPLTYYVPASEALVMLSGVYYGALYGGSTAAILLNIPGTPSAAVTSLDGYPMAQQGRAGVALLVSTLTSFVGGCIAIVALIILAPLLAGLVVTFGAAEYFAMMLLGLVAACTVSISSPLKNISMVLVGLLLAVVGTDVNTGSARFTFGILNLLDGLSLVAVAMGLLGISEVLVKANETYRRGGDGEDGSPSLGATVTFRSLIPSGSDLRAIFLPTLRGSMIGTAFGVLPGAGGPVASFFAYAVEKRVAKDPSRFGRGAIEGVASPEAANNAAAQAAFIPTLTLGIPGDAIMALMLGALILNGIQPGPAMLSQHGDLFWGLVASFWIGNIILLILNIPLIKLWVRILDVPYGVLYPAIIVLACIGVFSVSNSIFDVYTLVGAAVFGFLLMQFGFSGAPLLLGFILGPMIEVNMRRALLVSDGNFMIFLLRPVSAGLIAVTALLLFFMIFVEVRKFFVARS